MSYEIGQRLVRPHVCHEASTINSQENRTTKSRQLDTQWLRTANAKLASSFRATRSKEKSVNRQQKRTSAEVRRASGCKWHFQKRSQQKKREDHRAETQDAS